jgi:hypothetical protein
MHFWSVVRNSIGITSFKNLIPWRDSNAGLLFLRWIRCRLCHAARAYLLVYIPDNPISYFITRHFDPPKFTQNGIFGVKICRLATLLVIVWRVERNFFDFFRLIHFVSRLASFTHCWKMSSPATTSRTGQLLQNSWCLRAGWPDWANFHPMGDLLLCTVL